MEPRTGTLRQSCWIQFGSSDIISVFGTANTQAAEEALAAALCGDEPVTAHLLMS